MRHILLFALLLASTGASAQTTTLPLKVDVNKEVGLFGQVDDGANNSSFSMGGIQYKRWHNQRVGFRAIAAYGTYSTVGPKRYHTASDTTYIAQEYYNISLPLLGLGVEAQRQFYKRVSLFAALELSGGYGSGLSDTSILWTAGVNNNPSQYISRPFALKNVNLTLVGLTASLGAKLQWSRIVAGIEVLPVRFQYAKISGDVSHGGLLDISLWGMSHRIFLNYRLR
jgi:hypothetical protein